MNLFRAVKITTATDAETLAKNAITKCTNLLSQCIKDGPSRNTIKCLDEISNNICCAIDPLSACSRLHPDTELQNEASKAVMQLQNFMNALNNDHNIYNLLSAMQSDAALFESLSEEERQITKISLLEIKLSTAIHKTEEEREDINTLRHHILEKEDEFYRLCHDVEEQELILHDDESGKDAKWSVNHQNLGAAMKDWNVESHRKQMFELFYAHSDIRLNVLQSLREYRHSLALQIGYTSFSSLKSETSLFEGDIDGIQRYLMDLSDMIHDDCVAEAKELNQYNDNKGIKLWDITYTKRLKYLQEKEQNASNRETDIFIEHIEHYLEVQNCLQSLQRLMSIAFNIEMDKCLSEDPLIFKYELRKSVSNELIGVLYFDLFQRDNKSSECITYPLYCAAQSIQQIPHVIVSMNVRDAQNKFSLNQLDTLYHEFGHAISYLLCKTQYQTLSGSRGLSMEYLEFPSTFLENFVFDKYFLKYVIMDNQMMDIIPAQNILHSIKNPLNTNLHLMQQITDSLLDLALFGDDSKQKESINDIVYDVYKPLAAIMNMDDESAVQEALRGYLLRTSRFYHFIDYPANYYSYVIAEKISDSVWQKTFGNYQRAENTQKDQDRYLFEHWKNHMRYHGQRLYDDVFTFGCVRSPIQCLSHFSNSRIDVVTL